MNLYIFVVALNIVLLLVTRRRIKTIKRKHYLDTAIVSVAVICAILCFLMAFRDYSVGVDTFAYQRSYIKIANSHSFSQALKITTFTGPGYILLCWIFHYITVDPRWFMVLSAIIINVLLFEYTLTKINRELQYVLLWQTSYLFAFSLNGNRQVMATLFQLNALELLKNDLKSRKGWILAVIGVSIHPISVIIIILYFASTLLFKKLKYIHAVILGIAGGVFAHFFITVAVILFLRIVPAYLKYINNGVERGFFNNIGGGKIIYFYIFLLATMLFFALSHKDESGKYISEKTYVFITIMFCVLGILNSRNTTIFRLTMFFVPFGISVISQMSLNARIKRTKLAEVAIHIVFIIYMVLSLADNQSEVIPYILAL